MPIQEGAVKSELLDLSLKWSPLWKHFAENMFTLTENIRLDPDEREFSEFLIAVGNGDTNEADEGFLKLPEQFITDEDLVRHVYADLIDGLLPPEAIAEYLRGRCILAVLNRTCEENNRRVMKALPGNVVTYLSVNKFIPGNCTSRLMDEMPVEVMESANPVGLPPHELNLKVGAVIILMRNLNVRDSLCNGTRLLITRLGQRVINAQHISGDKQGRKVWIPRIGLRSSESNLKLPWTFKRTQFPVRPAFCLTINKSQVMTRFRKVELSNDKYF